MHTNNIERPNNNFDFQSLTLPLSAFAQYKPKPIIDSLIDESSCTLVFAPSGGMKSMFCLDMALCIAQGKPFLDLETHPRRTLYLDGEMSPVTVGKRSKAFLNPELEQSQFGYICTALDESMDGVNFKHEEQKEGFIQYILDQQYEVVILDNIRTLITLDDENSSAQFDSFNRFVKTMRNRGVTVIVVHHSNKDKANMTYAGSSNIATVFNTIIGLNEGEITGTRKLEIHKARDSDCIPIMHEKLIRFTDGKFEFLGIEDLDLEEAANLIIQFLKDCPPSIERTRDYIRTELHLSISNRKSMNWKLIYQNFIEGYTTCSEVKNYSAFEKLINESKTMH